MPPPPMSNRVKIRIDHWYAYKRIDFLYFNKGNRQWSNSVLLTEVSATSWDVSSGQYHANYACPFIFIPWHTGNKKLSWQHPRAVVMTLIQFSVLKLGLLGKTTKVQITLWS